MDIGPGWGLDEVRIRTIEILPDKKDKNGKEIALKEPLVLVHGFGSGIGHWILNLDGLSEKLPDRKIYAFDLLGFARSSRPKFNLECDVEMQYVTSIEKWRKAQEIDKFVMLGHSFGGYLSCCYSLCYPDYVSHLILADPWGIEDRGLTAQTSGAQIYPIPSYIKVAQSMLNYFAPLSVLRATGPYGRGLVHQFKSDLKDKFVPVLGEDSTAILDYVYHCNVQTPSGEIAFQSLTNTLASAKNPMVHRLVDLDESIPITFIHGGRSWISNTPAWFLKECLAPGRVDVQIIYGSGHHVNADSYQTFNKLVIEACNKTG